MLIPLADFLNHNMVTVPAPASEHAGRTTTRLHLGCQRSNGNPGRGPPLDPLHHEV